MVIGRQCLAAVGVRIAGGRSTDPHPRAPWWPRRPADRKTRRGGMLRRHLERIEPHPVRFNGVGALVPVDVHDEILDADSLA